MFNNFDAARAYVEQNGVQMIDLRFCDLWGRWHHLTVPEQQFTPRLMEDGVGFDGSSVGFKSVRAGDMVLVPDLSTGFIDPFCDAKTLAFICFTMEADTRELFPYDPRNIAERAEAYLRSTGTGDYSLWGPEYEFYIFDAVAFENTMGRTGYTIDCSEAAWTSNEMGGGYAIPIHGGYHAIPPLDKCFNLRSQMSLHLQAMGVPVKYHHHEVGGPGQCEIETALMGIMNAGDVTMLIKYVTKMTAYVANKTATFMPKPLFGEAGSGMHFHQQIFRGDTNLFYAPDGYGKLSQTALYAIGGLLQHGGAVMAFTNPSTNSYRRLVPGYEAPINAFFSLGNRSAAIRVPKYATQPDAARFEFRPPDATCNPYLALAAQLMACIDGIRNRIDPTASGFGPIDEDVFSWTEEQRKQIKSLPTSLKDAMDALSADYGFLLAGDVFNEDLIQRWISKNMQDHYAVADRPHPYEMELYYDL